MKLIALTALALMLGLAGTAAAATTDSGTIPTIPARGCIGASTFVRCEFGMKGVSLWLAKPPVVVKRGTTLTFRARVTDPGKFFAYGIRLFNGGINGAFVTSTRTSLLSRVKTAHATLNWKTKPGRYTVVLTDDDLTGTHPTVFASYAFVVR